MLLLVAMGCGKGAKEAPRADRTKHDAGATAVVADAAAAVAVASTAYPDLAAALKATIPADARILGFGEMHMRTDRTIVTSALARFTQHGLPAIAERVSDLVVETWFVDPTCGQKAQTATAKVEMTVRRPQETKSEIALLAEAAKAAKIQPHAMKLTCEDYEKFAPTNKDVDPDHLLNLTTKELGRISSEAVVYRTKKADKRPWIAVYGGALHHDRFPVDGVEMWSYAAKADEVSGNRFVEIDLIVPELAEADEPTKKLPWYPLVQKADHQVHVWQRGERSFVIVLPRTPAAK